MNLRDSYTIGLYYQYFRLAHYFLPQVNGDSYIVGAFNTIINILEKDEVFADLIPEIEQYKKDLSSKYGEDEGISEEDAKGLDDDTKIWFRKIREILTQKKVYEINIRSGLDFIELEKLSNKQPSEFITEDIWNKLTEIEKSDYSDAAKCLILNTATPSVMVALRGAEASVGVFYKLKTGDEIEKKTWRQLTSALKSKCEELGIRDSFIGFLDYIGDEKRNFAQHPNKIYSLREATLIFMQVITLVEDIYNQI